MALFFVNKAEHEGSLRDQLIVAHKNSPLLATGWAAPTSVLITDNEGEPLATVREPAGGAPAANKGLTVTALSWHPFAQVLLIGWSNGRLTMWCMPKMSTLGLDPSNVAPETAETYNSAAVQAVAAKAAAVSDVEGAVREHGAGAVVACEWTSRGRYLLTSSSKQSIVLWELEESTKDKTSPVAAVTYKLKPLWSIEAESTMVHAIHVPGVTAAQATANRMNKSTTDASTSVSAAAITNGGDTSTAVGEDDDVAFLLADGGKSVWLVTEEQKVSVCATQEERITSVLYDPKQRLMVTLNSSHMIDVYTVSEDYVASSTFRRKLSTPSPSSTPDRFVLTMVWAGPGVVAFGCGDDRVRVFDLNDEAVYMVPFPQEGTHITHIATNERKGLLAAGTAEGTLAIFQATTAQRRARRGSAAEAANQAVNGTMKEAGILTGGAGPAGRTSSWEALSTHDLGERVDRVVFNPLGDMAVCTAQRNLQVLHETVRKRIWDGIAAATQISAYMVVIESVTGCQCLLSSKTKIRGLSIAFPKIALWDGSRLDLYTINPTTSDYTHSNFVPTTSPVFALHQEGLFYVKEGRLLFTTFQLQPIAQLSFAEAEGVPVLLDVMNDYLVVVSSKNVLRLAKVSPRDLRPQGPSRPLNFQQAAEADGAVVGKREPITVASARVNAQGRRVALMTKVGVLGVPDTRVWVYDSDTDKLNVFDFASRNESPEAVYWNTPEPNANTIGELEYLLLACETHQVKSRGGAVSRRPLGESQNPSFAGSIPAGPHAAGEGASTTSNAGQAGGGGGGGGGRPVQQENLPEALPDMENFAEKKLVEESRRSSLGASNFVADRAHHLVTLFATRTGLVVHNSVTLKPYQICLVGLTIPDFLLASIKINGNPSNPADYVIEQKRLRDFDGLASPKDVALRQALMKFSYYSTIGNMDEAYRCIKMIKNPAAWQGLARMCVSNGRLDVAAVCLATMQDGVGARALREAREEYPNDKNVQLATLACSLGMTEEAEHLLRVARRFDMITDLYLASGKFEQAQRHSERLDRIRIRTVAYKYAQFMESLQNMDAAIMWYFNAKCAGTDVPRIYFQTNRLGELHAIMMHGTMTNPSGTPGATPTPPPIPSDDPQATFASLFPQNRELLLWWAQHSERRRNVQEALHFYQAAKDTVNVVRILCSLTPPKLENAVEIVNGEVEGAKARFQQQLAMFTSHDSANAPREPEPVGAGYFVGQVFERMNDVERALKYYGFAAAYHSGVRVARRAKRDGTVLSLSLASGDARLMLGSAEYFRKRRQYDRSVQLYRKVGATQCALDDCIKGGLYDTLHEISTSLAHASADPEVFLKMATHFQSTGNYPKAVEMLVFAKHYDEALQMCQDQNVTLTEEMAEAMTGDGNDLPAETKQALTRRVASIAKEQGSWNLASKKYIQVGERMKAMKMLMRGGDVDKVIFFAKHSRNNEMFVLAANFLQSQNWSADPNIFKSIVQFYTKAKAYDHLVSFYDSAAQLYIDENRNYPDALRVTEECIRALAGGNTGVSESKAASLKSRATLQRSLIKAQQIVDSMGPPGTGSAEDKKKGDEVIAICSDIVKRSRPNSPDHDAIEDALRIGDVFALLVRFYFEKLGEPRNALKVLESMPKHGVEPQFFLEMDMMEKVCTAAGKRLGDIVTIKSDTASAAEGRRRSSVIADEAAQEAAL